MSIRRLYFGIENLSLDADQKQTLVAGLQLLGANTDPSPARRNHWRIRSDNDAAIFEAAFDDTLLTVAAFKTRLAGIFNVASSLITNTTSNPAFGQLITFSYLATPRFRVLLFGGSAATYAESQAAVLSYLAANAVSWGDA